MSSILSVISRTKSPSNTGVASILGGGNSVSILGVQQNNTQQTSIGSILREAEIKTKKNNIFNTAIARLTRIRNGNLTPTAEWEKKAAAFQLAGQPFMLEIDDKGKLNAVAQKTDKLDSFSDFQKKKIKETVSNLEALLEKKNLVETREGLRTKLLAAATQVLQIESKIPPTTGFDYQIQRLINTKTPFKINLDKDGNTVIEDQTKSFFTDKGVFHQRALQNAVNAFQKDQVATVNNITTTTANAKTTTYNLSGNTALKGTTNNYFEMSSNNANIKLGADFSYSRYYDIKDLSSSGAVTSGTTLANDGINSSASNITLTTGGVGSAINKVSRTIGGNSVDVIQLSSNDATIAGGDNALNNAAYINLGNVDINPANGFTFASHINLAGSSNPERIFSAGTAGTDDNSVKFSTANNGRDLTLAIKNGSTARTLTVNNVLTPGTFQHVSFSLNGNEAKIYVDGAQVGVDANFVNSSFIAGTKNQAYIGRDNSTTATAGLNGFIGDILIDNGISHDRAEINNIQKIQSTNINSPIITEGTLSRLKVTVDANTLTTGKISFSGDVTGAVASTADLVVQPSDLTATISSDGTTRTQNFSISDIQTNNQIDLSKLTVGANDFVRISGINATDTFSGTFAEEVFFDSSSGEAIISANQLSNLKLDLKTYSSDLTFRIVENNSNAFSYDLTSSSSNALVFNTTPADLSVDDYLTANFNGVTASIKVSSTNLATNITRLTAAFNSKFSDAGLTTITATADTTNNKITFADTASGLSTTAGKASIFNSEQKGLFKVENKDDFSTFKGFLPHVDDVIKEARKLADGGKGFFFDINEKTGKVETRKLTFDNLVPDFLKKSKDEIASTKVSYLQKALEFHASKTPFRFNFLGNKIEALELNALELSGIRNPSNASEQIRGALLSLLS